MLRATLQVLSNTGTGISGAAVTLTIQKPNGVTLEGGTTTGSSGTVAFGYQFQRTDPMGTYYMTGTARVNGQNLSVSSSIILY